MLLSLLAGVFCLAVFIIAVGQVADVVTDTFTNKKDKTYYVAPGGDDSNTGLDKSGPLASIQLAFDRAQPGDTIDLTDGAYYQSISSIRSGTSRAPITLRGSKEAVIYGSSDRVIQIRHNFITLEGFQVNGQWAAGDSKDHFRDKLIYVIGRESKKGVEGFKVNSVLIQNAGGECVRMRYFAKNNEISNSVIRNCGIHDFRFGDGGKNGEGIYIGTAPEQLKDGKNPTSDPDESSGNHIHHNIIETYGNECVDIKEASFDNLVEHNVCRAQRDAKSGGFDARGNNNTFRYNAVEDTTGAAVRLGGDGDEDGINNNVYENTFRDNAAGPLNVQRMPQGRICDNSTTYEDKPSSDSDDIDPTTVCS
jgi:hypothetical protein